MRVYIYFKKNISKFIKILIIIFILIISAGCNHKQDENCDSKGCEVNADNVYELL